MRYSTTTLLSLLLVGACASNHKHEPKKQEELVKAQKIERAQSVAANMLNAIDKRDWKSFEQNFASKTVVYLDEPMLLKPEQITRELKPMYEYFETTKHEITDFKVHDENERMLGTAKVHGVFWKHGDIFNKNLTLDGKFVFEFVPEGDGFKISRVAFDRGTVEGEREFLKKAEGKISHKLNYKTQVVDFPSKNGKMMRGWLYIPNGRALDIVIINGNIGNVKEQGSFEYARRFAAKGTAAFVFDFVNFGESEGKVRNLEDPGQKINDFRGAVDYISSRKEFTATRISLAGLGASAGYAAAEATKDQRVDRLLFVQPWFQSPQLVQDFEPRYLEKLKAARESNSLYHQDGVVSYVPLVSFSDRNAVITSNKPANLDYYLKTERGNIPQWQNRFATMGWISWLNFDSLSYASRVRVPTLIVHNGRGNAQEGTKAFTERMRLKPEIREISAMDFDFYDREETIRQTVELMENFLNPAGADSEITAL